MERTARTLRGARGILVASSIALAAGLATTAAGLLTNDTARSATGASTIVVALAVLGLAALRRWITDTTAERNRLTEAREAADAERERYFAALAAVDAERLRVRRDAAVMANRQRAQLAAEREQLHQALERDRERIVTEAFQTAVQMERAGLLAEPEPGTVTHIYAHRARALAGKPTEPSHLTQRPS